MFIPDFLLIIVGFLSIYNLIIFPIILEILSRIIPKPISADPNLKPYLTILVAAYNEEMLLEGMIESIADSDYPVSKLKIIIGSDGSTDRTNEILETQSKRYPNLQYIILERSGKNKVINTLVKMADTEILVLMDVDIRLKKDTLSKLVSFYSHDSVGGVIASPIVKGGEDPDRNISTEGDSIFHKYEEYIRIKEGIVDSNVNSVGYLYSIKKSMFTPIPSDLVCDDLYTIYCVIRKKKRVVFSQKAIALEIRPKNFSNEFHRRVRAIAGGWATVVYFADLLNIFKYGAASFFIWSHKIFRWISPAFIILLHILTIFVDTSSIIFYIFAIPQILLYLFAIIGFILEKNNIKFSFFRMFTFFVTMNFSAFLGFFRFISRKQNAYWNREGFTNDFIKE